jgi:hypothetical protein
MNPVKKLHVDSKKTIDVEIGIAIDTVKLVSVATPMSTVIATQMRMKPLRTSKQKRGCL